MEAPDSRPDPYQAVLSTQISCSQKPYTGRFQGRDKVNYLVTGDLVGLTWNRTKSTYGAGLRFTFDENGRRLGLKGLWRKPLRFGRDAYLQFAPGLYLSATTDYRTPGTPGYFLDTELGLTRYFALVAILEVLSYEQRYGGFDGDRSAEIRCPISLRQGLLHTRDGPERVLQMPVLQG
ncbi:MAG: hypothetical protein GY838_17080 [bacterium]|nr:hypothetical protein [bacterium]